MNELWDRFADKSIADVIKKNGKKQKVETHVATIGRIRSIVREFADGYGEAEIDPIPLYDGEEPYTIKAMFFSDNYAVGDTAMVVFTDFDFRSNVRGGFEQTATQNKQIHSRAFGVLVRL